MPPAGVPAELDQRQQNRRVGVSDRSSVTHAANSRRCPPPKQVSCSQEPRRGGPTTHAPPKQASRRTIAVGMSPQGLTRDT